MNTAFLLMAQYDGLAVIPAEKVCADYFPHRTSRPQGAWPAKQFGMRW